jgi:hypothetical protein
VVLGEETKEFDNGQTSDAGSWEYGVDGALPGIVRLANPTVGDAYRQEYWAGEARTWARSSSSHPAVDGSRQHDSGQVQR